MMSSLRGAACWLALLAVTAWAYWPGLHGPMMLDDDINLRPLERLELSTEYAADVIRGNRSGRFGRSISMGSFTLERLYFDAGDFGQKRTGLLLHLLNATLVLLLARSLLTAASQPRAGWSALLIAGLWLTMPLLLSTTLYVIQRMTLLAAFFSLASLLLYSHGRQLHSGPAWPWFTLCGLSVVLAALSKENGLLAVPMIVAVEVFIFGFRDRSGALRRQLAGAHLAMVVIPLLGLLLLALVNPDRLFGGYELRPFGLLERLLTEARVLLDYLGQILWVDVHRLGVYQDDFSISRGLFDPASTAAALLFWIAAVAAVVASAVTRRFRLAGFGLAFFMIGHAMESTFIPLEIYFEHRNYLPSFGVLFALVALANQCRERWPALRGWAALVAILLVGRNLVLLGSQAVVWSGTHLLHMTAANHHPESERALLALAQVYAGERNLEEALGLVERANELAQRDGAAARVLEGLYYCMARQPLPETLYVGVAVSDEELANPMFGDHVYYMTRQVIGRRCDRNSALQFADQSRQWLDAGGELRGTPRILTALMLLENELERYPAAMQYAERLLEKEPDSVVGLQFTLYLSHVLDRPAQREAARSRLVELRDRGELSRQELANLELFLESP